jgi:RNA polymerase sigma-70 factor (ECF subfamily)
MAGLSNAALIGRCINGEKKAWDRFVQQFSPLIFWAIKNKFSRVSYHHNHQDIEDVFQNVFVLLWGKAKLQQIKDRDSISGWLVLVAANCTVDYLRAKNTRMIPAKTLTEEMVSVECPRSQPQTQKEINRLLEDTLNSLPAREIVILKLNYLYNKTHQEIGEILHISANTVSSIIRRTKQRLKERLSQDE